MLRADRALLLVLLVASCGENLDCPAGTTEHVQEKRGTRRRLCLLEDGITVHGPVVDIDPRGRRRLVGASVRGKRDGRWDDRSEVGSIVATYKDGVLDGRFTLRGPEGELIVEQNFLDGRPHGKRTEYANGNLRAVQYFERGKPTGIWELHANGAVEKRSYGADGVLIAIDGRSVPPPPSQLDLPNGTTLTRSECVRRVEAFRVDLHGLSEQPLCLDVFESVQLCTDDECRHRHVGEFMRRQ